MVSVVSGAGAGAGAGARGGGGGGGGKGERVHGNTAFWLGIILAVHRLFSSMGEAP
jgi:hypothetical protein